MWKPAAVFYHRETGYRWECMWVVSDNVTVKCLDMEGISVTAHIKDKVWNEFEPWDGTQLPWRQRRIQAGQ